MTTQAPQKIKLTIYTEPSGSYQQANRGMLDYIESCGVEYILRSRTELSDFFYKISNNKGRPPYPMLLLENLEMQTENAFIHYFCPDYKELKQIVCGIS